VPKVGRKGSVLTDSRSTAFEERLADPRLEARDEENLKTYLSRRRGETQRGKNIGTQMNTDLLDLQNRQINQCRTVEIRVLFLCGSSEPRRAGVRTSFYLSERRRALGEGND
jgi:hypothetical protein